MLTKIPVQLISQFSIGITILYCLWATPPKFRTEAYNSKTVFGAIRACSNNLAIITERWESTNDLAVIFELLATEIPLAESETVSPPSSYGEREIKRIGNDAAEEIRSRLPRVKSLVLNRETIRMIEEMITEDFPRDEGDATTDRATYLSTFSTSSLPLYQLPSPYVSDDQLGALGLGQTLEFPGSLSGFDTF